MPEPHTLPRPSRRAARSTLAPPARAALAAQQAALLAAIADGPPSQALELTLGETLPSGLRIYRANARAHAQRALAASYPCVQALLGESAFAALACALWRADPPRVGDLNRWGARLADFIAGEAQLAPWPYLADVARLEWALAQAEVAADVAPLAATFAWLANQPAQRLRAVLAPGWACLAARSPLVSLVLAHRPALAEPDSPPPSLPDAARAVQAGVAEQALVWRAGWRLRLRAVQPWESAALQALAQGGRLDALLRAWPGGAGNARAAPQAQPPDTLESPPLSLHDWLAGAVRAGWLIGLRRVTSAQSQSASHDSL